MVTEAADILGISRRSAYRAAANGHIPPIKIGRRLIVPTARLLDLLGLSGDDDSRSTGRQPEEPAPAQRS